MKSSELIQGNPALSIRLQICCRALPIKTVGELKQMDIDELLKYRNFGRKTIAEIRDIEIAE